MISTLEKYKVLETVYPADLIEDLYNEISSADLGAEAFPSIDLFERLLKTKIEHRKNDLRIKRIKEIIALIDQEGVGYLDRLNVTLRDSLVDMFQTDFHFILLQHLGGYDRALSLKAQLGREEFLNYTLGIAEDLCL